MTLQKAIQVVTIACTSSEPHLYPDYLEATQLLIEAGKGFICGREGLRTEFFTLLPGETKGGEDDTTTSH